MKQKSSAQPRESEWYTANEAGKDLLYLLIIMRIRLHASFWSTCIMMSSGVQEESNVRSRLEEEKLFTVRPAK